MMANATVAEWYKQHGRHDVFAKNRPLDIPVFDNCLLYTSDAADERSSVDLGGRRIIKKKKMREMVLILCGNRPPQK